MIRVIKFVEEPFRVREIEIHNDIITDSDHEMLSDYVSTYMLCWDIDESDIHYEMRKDMLAKAKKGIFVILHDICRRFDIKFKFFKTIYFQNDILYVKV